MMSDNLKAAIGAALAQARADGQWPAIAVLHMLLGAYNAGQRGAFARYVAGFTNTITGISGAAAQTTRKARNEKGN